MRELTEEEARQIELEDWNNRPYRSKKEARKKQYSIIKLCIHI